MIHQFLKRDLAKWEADGLIRTCVEVTPGVGANAHYEGMPVKHFAGNDYLGLSQHPNVIEAFKNAVDRYGVGAGASQVVSGYTAAHRALEEELAAFTGRDAVLLFSSGYLANIATINGLIGNADYIWHDRLNHASLLDAGRLCGAGMWRYPHGDDVSLAKRIAEAKSTARQWIITEGVFSMDGDLAPLPQLVTLARHHNAQLMVDDAHGFGVIGRGGRGTLDHYGVSMSDVPLLTGAFGKAFGSSGAFVAGEKVMIESIRQFARPYICTTAIPAALAQANRMALQIMQQGEEQEKLQHIIRHFNSGVAALGLPITPSVSAIQPLIIGTAEKASTIHKALLEKGFFTGMMRPPTVPPNSSRLRITLSAKHHVDDVDQLLTALTTVLAECSDD